jgi:hypothetical protein
MIRASTSRRMSRPRQVMSSNLRAGDLVQAGDRLRRQSADLGWSRGRPRPGPGGGFECPDLAGAGQAGCAGADRGQPQREFRAERRAGGQTAGHVLEDLPVSLARGAVAWFPLRDHLQPGRGGRRRPRRCPWRPSGACGPSGARLSPWIHVAGATSGWSHRSPHASSRTRGTSGRLRAPVRSDSLLRFQDVKP